MKNHMINKNKRGLARIIEAVIAVLLVATVLLIIANNRNIGTSADLSELIPPFLDEIAQNQTLREKILDQDPAKVAGAKSDVLAFLDANLPDPKIKRGVEICNAGDVCALTNFPADAEEIFTRERIIASDNIGNSKKVKIFLWKSSS